MDKGFIYVHHASQYLGGAQGTGRRRNEGNCFLEEEFRDLSWSTDMVGQPIWWVNPKPDILTYSDASDSGWGGYSVELGGNIAKGQWSAEEELKSSTWRELRATHLVLKSFLPNIQGKEVRHRTDNQNLGYVHTVTFLHGFVLFHNPKGIPIYFQTIENDAKT